MLKHDLVYCNEKCGCGSAGVCYLGVRLSAAWRHRCLQLGYAGAGLQLSVAAPCGSFQAKEQQPVKDQGEDLHGAHLRPALLRTTAFKDRYSPALLP